MAKWLKSVKLSHFYPIHVIMGWMFGDFNVCFNTLSTGIVKQLPPSHIDLGPGLELLTSEVGGECVMHYTTKVTGH